jgi:hypothetical protein
MIQRLEVYSGPQAYQQFQSPYQQDIIDATLAEYDTQAAAGMTGIGQQAAMSGNLGGGREGVMRSQYQNKSDLNRALLQSGLLQQGYTQSNQLANQAFGQQMQQLGQKSTRFSWTRSKFISTRCKYFRISRRRSTSSSSSSVRCTKRRQ